MDLESDARSNFRKAVATWDKLGDGNFSYDPATGIRTNVTDKGDQCRLLDNHSVDGMPVYLVGVTNNRGEFNRDAENAYVELIMAGKTAIMGQWADTTGTTYKDVVLVASGIDEDGARILEKAYRQMPIVEVARDGVRFV